MAPLSSGLSRLKGRVVAALARAWEAIGNRIDAHGLATVATRQFSFDKALDVFAFHQSAEICANLWIKLFEASTPRGLARYSAAIFDPQIFRDFHRFLIYAVVSPWFELPWKT